MKKALITLITMLALALGASIGDAAITFDEDGKWETTFDCDAQDQTAGYGLVCDGLVYAGAGGGTTELSRITSDANNPEGGGGRGARFWKGGGPIGERIDNCISRELTVIFPEKQPELWIRWYERFEEGFWWNRPEWGYLPALKSLYIHSVNPSAEECPGLDCSGSHPYFGKHYGVWRIVHGGGTCMIPSSVSSDEGYGWPAIYPYGEELGTMSDGSWTKSIELYIKMESCLECNDGIIRMWYDGVLIANNTNMQFAMGCAPIWDGWTYFNFLGNQKDPGLGRDLYVDVDDMTIYNTTPPNEDEHGNPMIGPLGWGENGNGDPPTVQGARIVPVGTPGSTPLTFTPLDTPGAGRMRVQ
jgi:hypothetical protein